VSIPTVPPALLKEWADAGRAIDMIDVRTPAEYRELHVAFARNVPLDRLDPAGIARSRAGRACDPLYVICQSGTRGRLACDRLLAAGCLDVVNVEGGTPACAAAGLPVVRGSKAVSLERQVRVAAGLVVVLGAVLGWLVHPAFVGLSAFVGAGLVVAGLTDTCGMGMLLARMPWNRAAEPAIPCSRR
jgi:rhodanese-related sulfurtransferase